MGMTNAFAIALLKQDIQNSKLNISYYHNDVGIEALELAIKTLEQQPCEDCVSRKDAVRIASINSISVDEFVKMIKELPSVTPTITDVENNYNIGYNCGYTDAMIDIAESEE